MTKNMGNIDRIIRVMIAIGIVVLYYKGVINGTLGIVLLIVAAIFLITGIISFCPLYLPFKIKTHRKKQ